MIKIFHQHSMKWDWDKWTFFHHDNCYSIKSIMNSRFLVRERVKLKLIDIWKFARSLFPLILRPETIMFQDEQWSNNFDWMLFLFHLLQEQMWKVQQSKCAMRNVYLSDLDYPMSFLSKASLSSIVGNGLGKREKEKRSSKFIHNIWPYIFERLVFFFFILPRTGNQWNFYHSSLMYIYAHMTILAAHERYFPDLVSMLIALCVYIFQDCPHNFSSLSLLNEILAHPNNHFNRWRERANNR